MECRTLPIKWGISNTKIFLYSLIAITGFALFLADYFYIQFNSTLTLRYIIFGLALPFTGLCVMIYRAKSKSDFHQASDLLKVIMFIGVMYSFVFYFLQAKTFGISLFNLFILK
jgi:4-hydroxybenzoate polyprenyltransferase